MLWLTGVCALQERNWHLFYWKLITGRDLHLNPFDPNQINIVSNRRLLLFFTERSFPPQTYDCLQKRLKVCSVSHISNSLWKVTSRAWCVFFGSIISDVSEVTPLYLTFPKNDVWVRQSEVRGSVEITHWSTYPPIKSKHPNMNNLGFNKIIILIIKKNPYPQSCTKCVINTTTVCIYIYIAKSQSVSDRL